MSAEKKVVVYTQNNKFYGTTPENYEVGIRDRKKILDFSSFASFEQVVEYFKKYCPYVTVIRGGRK